MPHILNLSDGTKAVRLTTTGVMLSHYVPKTATPVPGSDWEYQDVTEPIEVLFHGATPAEAQAAQAAVQNMLTLARLRTETGKGIRVFLQYQPVGNPTGFRAEVRGGDIHLAEDAMTAFGQAKYSARIILTRAGVWDGVLTECKLTATGQTELGGGKAIHNHTAGNAGNFVNIPPGQVTGSLPTPALISLTNINNATRKYENIYIGNEVLLNDDHHFCVPIQGESFAAGSTATVSSNRTGSSNNALATINLNGSATLKWDKSNMQIRMASGQTYRVFARFPFYPSNFVNPIYVRVGYVKAGGFADLNPYSEEIALPTSQAELRDVGAIAFGDFPLSAAMAIQMRLTCKQASLVELDFIQPLPANNLRQLVYLGDGVPHNYRLVDDGIENRTYVQTPEGEQLAELGTHTHKPLLLYPNTGRNQRIYVLQDLGFQAPINEALFVRIYYRPRRVTI